MDLEKPKKSKYSQLWFTETKTVEVRHEENPSLQNDEVTIETIISGISPGTEMKVYKGEFHRPKEDGLRNSNLCDNFDYPTQYGYCLVGKIVAIGKAVKGVEMNDIVFAFHSHEERFNCNPDSLMFVPKDIDPLDAVFLPNVETAVNFLHDGKPLVGEKIAIFGQGIVGLLTAYLCTQIPFTEVYTFDLMKSRRHILENDGVMKSIDPNDTESIDNLSKELKNGFDLTIEVSGSPLALSKAIQLTGYNGRLIIGSWYGNNMIELELGQAFHRSHMNIIASQVSNISPLLSARWDKQRRFEVVWNIIRKLKPSKFITHKFSIEEAQKAYQILDENPDDVIQIVFLYPNNVQEPNTVTTM